MIPLWPFKCYRQLKHIKRTCVIKPWTVFISQKIPLYCIDVFSWKLEVLPMLVPLAVAAEPNPTVCLSVHSRIPRNCVHASGGAGVSLQKEIWENPKGRARQFRFQHSFLFGDKHSWMCSDWEDLFKKMMLPWNIYWRKVV